VYLRLIDVDRPDDLRIPMRTDEPEIIEDYISGETVRAASYVKQVWTASTKAGLCLVDSDGIAATEDDLAAHHYREQSALQVVVVSLVVAAAHPRVGTPRVGEHLAQWCGPRGRQRILQTGVALLDVRHQGRQQRPAQANPVGHALVDSPAPLTESPQVRRRDRARRGPPRPPFRLLQRPTLQVHVERR
jgi:hypothetical protein